MEPSSRITAFYTSVKERFAFLHAYGYRISEADTYNDRYGMVRIDGPGPASIIISWDSFDTSLEAKLGTRDLWAMLADEGRWYTGRIYEAYSVVSMQHGLDRLAGYFRSHPDLLQAGKT